MLQNALLDINEDELAALGDEESAPPVTDTRTDTSLTELQSFVDLLYTHGRSVTALQWLPHRVVQTRTGCLSLDANLVHLHYTDACRSSCSSAH